MITIRTAIPTLAVTALGALAIALAPLAAAAPSAPTCTTNPNSTLCQRPGDAELSATPPPVQYQPMYPFAEDGGLLFHHK